MNIKYELKEGRSGLRLLLSRIVFALVLTISVQSVAWAQQITVKGKVTEVADDFGLPGVNVFEQGTTNGTITDIDGNFVLSVSPEANIVFSYIGYKKQIIAVNNRSSISASLSPDIEQLEEIVVVGYGGQEKGDVTGVVAEVKAESFNKGLIASPTQLLNGKVAGVQITPNSGEPGGQIKIKVRGGTSILASNEPLYVIDGFPINPNVFDPGGAAKGRDPRSFLIPSHIESITVLKDASSAAIYGSRAANGVIMITTKKGSNGRPRVTYNGAFATSEIIGRPKMLSTQQFKDALRENDFRATLLLGESDTDWFGEVTQTAHSQLHDLLISGGGENNYYSLALSRQDIGGVLKNTGTERTNMAFNYGAQLLDGALSINLHTKSGLTEDVFSKDVIENASTFDPTQSIFDSANAQYGGYFEWTNDLAPKNPVAQVDLPKELGKSFRTITNFQAEYELPFLKGFKIKTNLGYDGNFANRRIFEPRTLRQARVDLNGRYFSEKSDFESSLIEWIMSYKTVVGKHSVEGIAGYSYQNFTSDFTNFQVETQQNDLFGINRPILSDESAVSVIQRELENRLISFFGRVFYSLHDRYLLTATIRRDGSTRFGPSNRWGIFPSFSVGWRVLDEPFARSLSSTFSNLKFRLGYGISGNQEIPDFQYISSYGLSEIDARYEFGDGRFVNTLRPVGVDPDLKWEETSELNIGVEFGILDGRFSGSVEYYNKNTDDLLLDATFPAGQALSDLIITNIGKVNNRGAELTLNTVVIDKPKVRWDIDVNAAYNRNKIVNLNMSSDDTSDGIPKGNIEGGQGENIQRHKVGESVFSFFVFEHKLGDDGKPISDDGRLPIEYYVDQNNDNQITVEDQIIYKKAAPDMTMGLTSNLTIGDFDFSFTLRSSIGNYVYNNTAAAYGAYTELNPSRTQPQNIHESVLTTNFKNQQLFSNYFIEDGSFVKLDNLTLGYDIPVPGIEKFRVFVTGQNLLTLTGYSGLDPEVDEGRDTSVYPRSRTLLAGINLTF